MNRWWRALLVGAALVVTGGCEDRRKENLVCRGGEGWRPFEVRDEARLTMQLTGTGPACLVVDGTWSSSTSDLNVTALGAADRHLTRRYTAAAVLYQVHFPAACFSAAATDAGVAAPFEAPTVDGVALKSATSRWDEYPGHPVCFTAGSCSGPVTVSTRIHDDYFEDNMNTGGLCATLVAPESARVWLERNGPTPPTSMF